MTDMKSGLRFLICLALASGTVLLAGCSDNKVTRTTSTTEQSSSTPPMAPATSTTTTTDTNTQQYRN
ncbi:MAG: hypothetical protein ABSC26_01430 [Stellaceae bacterium]